MSDTKDISSVTAPAAVRDPVPSAVTSVDDHMNVVPDTPAVPDGLLGGPTAEQKSTTETTTSETSKGGTLTSDTPPRDTGCAKSDAVPRDDTISAAPIETPLPTFASALAEAIKINDEFMAKVGEPEPIKERVVMEAARRGRKRRGWWEPDEEAQAAPDPDRQWWEPPEDTGAALDHQNTFESEQKTWLQFLLPLSAPLQRDLRGRLLQNGAPHFSSIVDTLRECDFVCVNDQTGMLFSVELVIIVFTGDEVWATVLRPDTLALTADKYHRSDTFWKAAGCHGRHPVYVCDDDKRVHLDVDISHETISGEICMRTLFASRMLKAAGTVAFLLTCNDAVYLRSFLPESLTPDIPCKTST